MAVIDWTTTGLIPQSGLIVWPLYDPLTSASGNIVDGSGNGYDLTQGTTPPVLTLNRLYGNPGWFFSGSSNPLQTIDDEFIAKTVFVLASATGSAFDLNRGLVSGLTTGDWLTSESSGTQFFSFGADYDYRKSDTAYADASMEAPLNETAELMEITHPDGITMDGLQIGQQKGLDSNARKWKGYFYELMMWDRELTALERQRVHLYFNVKFRTFQKGVPLYFPEKRLLANASTVILTRYVEVPKKHEKRTNTFEYDDGGKDYNTISDGLPEAWDYGVKIAESNARQADAYRTIFDRFSDAVGVNQPFYFRDKYDVVWSDVRVTDYSRTHDAHKSWVFDVLFNLESDLYESTSVYDPIDEVAPDTPGPFTVIEGTETPSIHLEWDASPDGTGTGDTLIDEDGETLYEG